MEFAPIMAPKGAGIKLLPGALPHQQEVAALYRPASSYIHYSQLVAWRRELRTARDLWARGVSPGGEFGGQARAVPDPQSASELRQRRAAAVAESIFHEGVVDVINCYGKEAWELLRQTGLRMRQHGIPQQLRPESPSAGIALLSGARLQLEPQFADSLARALRIERLAAEDAAQIFPPSLRFEAKYRSGRIWNPGEKSSRAEGEYQFIYELAFVVAGLDSERQSSLAAGAVRLPFTGQPRITPINELFEGRQLVQLSAAQHELAWKFRKRREEGGVGHRAFGYSFSELPDKERLFVLRFTPLYLNALRGFPRPALQYLSATAGSAIRSAGVGEAPLRELERPSVWCSFPAANGRVQLDPRVLNPAAATEHNIWRTVVEWSKVLPDPHLRQPDRRDGANVPWTHVVERLRNLSRLSVAGFCFAQAELASGGSALPKLLVDGAPPAVA